MVFELDSTFNNMSVEIFVIFLVLLSFISVRGYMKIDAIRWEVSRWGS